MFDLAHALMLGNAGGGQFQWRGLTAINVNAYDNSPAIFDIDLFTDGKIISSTRTWGSIDEPREFEGAWLSVLQENFGNVVEVRVTDTITSASGGGQTFGDPLDTWLSLNTPRRWTKQNSYPIPSTVSGYFTFEFRMINSPVVELEQEFRYYLARIS